MVREPISRLTHPIEPVIPDNLKAPTALIFDMDGVLIDSEPLHKRAKERAFEEHGILLPESVYDSYKGRPDATMLPEILGARGWSAERIQEFSRRKRQFYEEIEHELRAVAGAVDFVVWAAARYKLALATSSTKRNRETTFKVLGIGEQFAAIVDASGHTRPKPEPEVFLVAMRKLGVSPEDCWIIEDSVNGVKAAKAAGALAVGITTTFARETLLAVGANMIVDSFAELRMILAKL